MIFIRRQFVKFQMHRTNFQFTTPDERFGLFLPYEEHRPYYTAELQKNMYLIPATARSLLHIPRLEELWIEDNDAFSKLRSREPISQNPATPTKMINAVN